MRYLKGNTENNAEKSMSVGETFNNCHLMLTQQKANESLLAILSRLFSFLTQRYFVTYIVHEYPAKFSAFSLIHYILNFPNVKIVLHQYLLYLFKVL